MATLLPLPPLPLRPLHHQMDLNLKPANEAARMEKKKEEDQAPKENSLFTRVKGGEGRREEENKSRNDNALQRPAQNPFPLLEVTV